MSDNENRPGVVINTGCYHRIFDAGDVILLTNNPGSLDWGSLTNDEQVEVVRILIRKLERYETALRGLTHFVDAAWEKGQDDD